jgi:N-acetylglucosamine-6-phosphate deacetylase
LAVFVDRQEVVTTGGGLNRIGSNLDVAVGTILKANGSGQARGQLTTGHSDYVKEQQGVVSGFLAKIKPKAIAAGRRLGLTITPELAWTWLSLNPAKGLGIGDRTGSLEAGKAADVVLWSAEPFSVYARPTHVWIDGALMYDWGDPKRRPTADFELGQPGAGEVK